MDHPAATRLTHANPMTLALADTDLDLDLEEEKPALPFLQTQSLGSKQSTVRWLPKEVGSGVEAVAAAGSADERVCKVALWGVSFDVQAADDDDAMGREDDALPSAQQLCAADHDGCVLDASVGEGQPTTLFTASGAGGVSCYAVKGLGGDVPELSLKWREDGHSALATLGVACHEARGWVASVGEDGVVALLDAERGAATRRVKTDEPALYDVSWLAGGDATAVTAGGKLSLWDMRTDSRRPCLALRPEAGAPEHLGAQLQCVASDGGLGSLLAAGSSDGAIYLWDVRMGDKGPSCTLPPRRLAHHAADVWGLQLAPTPAGNLFSCSSDGTVQARAQPSRRPRAAAPPPSSAPPAHRATRAIPPPPSPLLPAAPAPACPAPAHPARLPAAQAWTLPVGAEGHGDSVGPEAQALIELALPVNAVHYSPQLGLLAAASDSEVLSFVDLRGDPRANAA